MAGTVLLYAVVTVLDPLPLTLSELFQKFASSAVFFGAAALCVRRGRTSRGDRFAWGLFALATVLWGTASLYYTVFLWDLAEVPVPSVADGFWLAFYLPSYAAIYLMLRRRVSLLRRGAWLDILVGGLGVGGAAAALVFGFFLDNTSGTPAAIGTNLAYPLGDIGLLALVVGGTAVLGWTAPGAWRWIAAAFVLFGVADSAWLVLNATSTYTLGGILDVGWPAAALLIGIAAWLPEPRLLPAAGGTGSRFVAPAAFGVSAVALLVVDQFVKLNPLAVGLALASLFFMLLRLYMTVLDNARLFVRSHRDATTDALTGLGNRRKLFADMERALASAEEEGTVALGIFDLDGFKAYNDTFGHPAGDALLARLGDRLAAAVGDGGSAYRIGGDEFVVVTSAVEGERLLTAAQAALSEQGDAFSIGCSLGLTRILAGITLEEALHAADQRLYTNKRSLHSEFRSEAKDALLQVLAEQDETLVAHLSQVAALAQLTALHLGLSPEQALRARLAAELHDVGKAAIPASILNKPGPLTTAERSFMERHSTIGERIVAAAPTLLEIAPIVRAAHERVDGGGYPDGLCLEEIPICSRIIAVVDAFDAMTSDRPYRQALSVAAALTELRQEAGTQFDRAVVQAFATAYAAHVAERLADQPFTRAGRTPAGQVLIAH